MLGATRRSLGRLAAETSSLSKAYIRYKPTSYIYGFTTFNGFTSFNSFKSLQASRWTHIGENPESTYHQVDDKAKRGSNSGPLLPTINHPEKGTEVEEEFAGIKNGDVINLSDLLFSENRDYLIKCNDHQQVKAEQLAGKVLVIYFDSVLKMDTEYLTSLRHIYNDLQPKNCFEVVFVDVNDVDASFNDGISHAPCQGVREDFKDVFSSMSWTAIPLSDITSRMYLKQIFGIPKRLYIGTSFVVDSTGRILQCDTHNVFLDYGAMGYPFSDERINILKSEDDAAVRQPSMKKLLASPERDYLISNKMDKVPIHTLEDKVVVLYMYRKGFTDESITEELKIAYEELAKNNKNFEVVLIYHYDTASTYKITNEESFWKTFKNMPWLALPYRDSSYKKLKRIFEYPWDDEEGLDFTLIVLGPHMEFIEPFGLFILQTFKVPAYPFSRRKVAKLLSEEAKELKLEMLWDLNSAFGKKYGSQVQFTQLAGKRVIILYDWRPESTKFLKKLKKRYIQLKGTDDEFEVIHITIKEHVANLPWFVQPWFVQPMDEYTDAIKLFDFDYYYNHGGGPNLTAIDRDGRVVRKTIYPTFENMDFPFYHGDFEEEVFEDLVTMFESDHFNDLYRESIYSYEKKYD